MQRCQHLTPVEPISCLGNWEGLDAVAQMCTRAAVTSSPIATTERRLLRPAGASASRRPRCPQFSLRGRGESPGSDTQLRTQIVDEKSSRSTAPHVGEVPIAAMPMKRFQVQVMFKIIPLPRGTF